MSRVEATLLASLSGLVVKEWDYDMIEIILVRHGETDWNIAEVFRGRIDIELNGTGRKQAELLSEYLKDSNISAIYSSPLKRAFKTAEIIASHHSLDVEIAPGLIDFNYGEWQGLSHEVVKGLYKELYFEWNKNPHQVKMPAGESLNDVRGRVSSVIDSIVTRNEGTIVLVAHRVVNKVLICFLLGLDNSHFWNIKQYACGITTFTYENKRFVLIKHNDISFLGLMSKAHLSDF